MSIHDALILLAGILVGGFGPLLQMLRLTSSYQQRLDAEVAERLAMRDQHGWSTKRSIALLGEAADGNAQSGDAA